MSEVALAGLLDAGLGNFDGILEHLWPSEDHLKAILGRPWVILKPSWIIIQAISGYLEAVFGYVESIWTPCWALLQ